MTGPNYKIQTVRKYLLYSVHHNAATKNEFEFHAVGRISVSIPLPGVLLKHLHNRETSSAGSGK